MSCRWLALLGLASCSTDPEPPPPAGVISFDTSETSGFETARFYTVDSAPVLSTIGPCQVVGPPSFPWMAADAGMISVSATSQDFFWSPDPLGNYMDKTLSTPVFQAGESITVTAPGHTVPGINQTVIAPDKIIVTAPTPPAQFGISLTIATDADYTVSWTGGSESVRVTLSDVENRELLVCLFPASDGTATIPKEALALFARQAGGISIDSVAVVDFPTRGWRLELNAVFFGEWLGGDLASSPVDYR